MTLFSKIRSANFTILVVLVFYLCSFLGTNVFHTHLHHEDHEHIHSEEAEQSPCHISIYHANSTSEKCQHNEHLKEADDDCSLCDLILKNKVALTKRQPKTKLYFFNRNIGFKHKSSQKPTLYSYTLRGPPFYYTFS